MVRNDRASLGRSNPAHDARYDRRQVLVRVDAFERLRESRPACGRTSPRGTPAALALLDLTFLSDDISCAWCGRQAVSDDIEPVIAVEEMIESLGLPKDDAPPSAPAVTTSIDIDLKHEKADIQITERF